MMRHERWQRRFGLCLVLLACLASLGPGLGSASALTYHEAFVVQGASEILASGQWWHPTIGGLPWLEKPPLPFWLVAGMGWLAGQITPTFARIPSALAATLQAVGIAHLGMRRYGPNIGILAGLLQATTAWWVFRGRLAEADIFLACIMTWNLIAFDALRVSLVFSRSSELVPLLQPGAFFWRFAFFALLGLGALVKGTGFGAVLVLSVVLSVLFCARQWCVLRYLLWGPGWALSGVTALGWPLVMLTRYGPGVISLWTMHIRDRLLVPTGHGQFAGEPWWSYVLAILGQGLPWTPLALMGIALAIRQHRWAWKGKQACLNGAHCDLQAGNGLLWAWTLIPLALVSTTRARNAHYAIHAMAPWSLWAASGLVHVAALLQRRGWFLARGKRMALVMFCLLPVMCGLGHWLAGPEFEQRRLETAFYESVGRQLRVGEDLALLYDTWDRDPYYTPFGQIPHDLAVRLYYLQRPASWHLSVNSLANYVCTRARGMRSSGVATSLVIIGRDRDLDSLRAIGSVEVLAHGPTRRWDRSYVAVRLRPNPHFSPI